jgi:glycosyltransferase involved in cell wall biosynthesis
MRVLMVANSGGVVGGHSVQARNTAATLRELGADVTLTDRLDEGTSSYDVVHTFGASNQVVRAGRRRASAVVATPIWWSLDYQTTGGRSPRLSQRMEFATRLAFSVSRRGVHETARRLRQRFDALALAFEAADLLLPNSHREAEQIRDDLGVSTPMHIVPNAVDQHVFRPPDEALVRQGVAYVGRIEPHKNQLGLIRELRGTGISLLVAGPCHPHHVEYAERCRKEADSLVTFHPGGGAQEMREVYWAAAAHVLPSWFETTGLASLEAAATGCAVVTTNRGYAKEYFGDLAIYCDPGRRGSIRDAVQTALSQGASPSLRRRVVENYTWEHAARATLSGYELALAS